MEWERNHKTTPYTFINKGIFRDLRCACGHKLMEVECQHGSIVRIKCRKCGTILRVEL